MKIPFLSKLFEKRSTYLQAWKSGDPWPGAKSASGIYVTPDVAMTVSTVFACVKILSETMATFPLHLYKNLPDGGKDRDSNHPLYNVLHRRPNRWQTGFEFREMMMAHCALRGNAYSEIFSSGGQAVSELIPIHPGRVTPQMDDDGKIRYVVSGKDRRILPQGKIFHLRGLSDDGLRGKSPIDFVREPVGMAKATEQFGARFFSNGAAPGGVLKHPGTLSENAERNMRDSWQKIHGGSDNAHSIAVLEEGVEWAQVGLSNEDSQFLETRKFTVEEIARIYRIPMHLLQALDRSTFNNIAHQSMEFVMYTMLPWVKRWEEAIHRDLLSETDQQTHFTEFAVQGLLRGDQKTRNESYAIGRRNGWYSINDIRRMENLNPVTGGDEYLTPLNMVPIGKNKSAEIEPEKVDPKEQSRKQSNPDGTLENLQTGFTHVLSEVLGRAIRKENKTVERLLKKFQSRDEFAGQVEAFFEGSCDKSGHIKNVVSEAGKVFRSYAIARNGDVAKADKFAETFGHRYVNEAQELIKTNGDISGLLSRNVEELSKRELLRFDEFITTD